MNCNDIYDMPKKRPEYSNTELKTFVDTTLSLIRLNTFSEASMAAYRDLIRYDNPNAAMLLTLMIQVRRGIK